MSSFIYRHGYFPFPIVNADLWNNSDYFQIPIFDLDIPTIRDFNLYIPGKTGDALTSGALYADGSPVLNFIPVVGPGTMYPCGMSLDAAMRIFWRVQTWAYSNTYTNPSGTATQANTIYTGGENTASTGVNIIHPDGPGGMVVSFAGIRYNYNNLSTGINLILSFFDRSIITTDRIVQHDPNFVWYGVFGNGTFMGGNGVPPAICYEPTAKLYYPLIVFGPDSLNFDATYSSMTSKFEIIGGSTYGPGVGMLTFTELTLSFAFSSTYTDGGGTTVSESITLEPLAYWDYDPGNGDGPFYDTTTGNQL
jgi:hypothetical protein